MVRRHAAFDPLEPSSEPRWYIVRNMHGAILEAQSIPLEADLKRVFVASMLAWIDEGWQLGEFSSAAAVFFCTRAGERRMVAIQPVPPGSPGLTA